MTTVIFTQDDKLQRLMTLSAEAAAAENFFTMNLSSVYKDLVLQIKSIFQYAEDLVVKDDIPSLKSDQKKFVGMVQRLPYTSMTSIRAYSPEGMIKSYLEYLDVLYPASIHLKGILTDVLQPYAQYLARYVSDHQFTSNVNQDKRDIQQQEKVRADFQKKFQHCYGRDQFGGVTTVGKVIHRNSDWAPVFKKMNDVVANMDSVDRTKLENTVRECTDYIEMIANGLKEEKNRKVSQEAANRLGEYAHSVARELEFFSVTYYRTIALVGAIDKTIESIDDVMG